MNPFGELIIIALIAISFSFIGYLAGKNDAHKEYCSLKGAIYVQGSDGWICLKGEKL